MSLIAAILFAAATFNGCPATATYQPLVVHACNTVYLCAAPGAVYGADGTLTAYGCKIDRVFASSMGGGDP